MSREKLQGTTSPEFELGNGDIGIPGDPIAAIRTTSGGEFQFKNSGGPWTSPGSGADEKVKHADNPLETAGYLDAKLAEGVPVVRHDPAYVPTELETEGTTYFDSAENCLSTVLQNGIIIQHGQELFVYGKNASGAPIANGQPVSIAAAAGQWTAFERTYITDGRAYAHIGCATQDIPDNGWGLVTIRGKVRKINTNHLDEGKPFYVAVDGTTTKTYPTVPNYVINGGMCTRKSETVGELLIIPATVPKLLDLSDVNGTPFTKAGQFLAWNQAGQYFDGTENVRNFAPKVGFENRTDSKYSIDGSGNFTLEPTVLGGSFNVWLGNGSQNSREWTLNAAQTVQVTADRVDTYIFLDTDGVLKKSISPWSILGDAAPVALVFKDGTVYAPTDERHSANRNRVWHDWAHHNIGTLYRSGFAGTFGNTSFSFTQGIVSDEDISADSGGTQTVCTLWYRDTVAGQSRIVRNSSTVYPSNAGTLQWDNAGVLTNVTNNSYVKYWVYGTADGTNPIYSVVAQSEHASLTGARNAPAPEIRRTTKEWKLLYTVIYRNAAGTTTYIENADYRNVSTGVPTDGTTPASHSNLTDRDAAGSHPATAISFDDGGAGSTVQATLADHSARHESGGADAIKLDDLATPDDNTDLNATTGRHGLLLKLGGGTTNFLRADGTWAAPPGGSSVYEDWWQAGNLAQPSGTTGFMYKTPKTGTNDATAGWAQPITTPNDDYNNGALDPFLIPETGKLTEIRIWFSAASVSGATVGAAPVVRITFYRVNANGVGRTSLGDVDVPSSATGVGIYNNVGSNSPQSVLYNMADISVTAGWLVGWQFTNRTADNNAINAISRLETAVHFVADA